MIITNKFVQDVLSLTNHRMGLQEQSPQYKIIKRISEREVDTFLEEGWYFNTLYNVDMATPPATILAVKATPGFDDLAVMGGVVKRKTNTGYVALTTGVIHQCVIDVADENDLPKLAWNYLIHIVAAKYMASHDGDFQTVRLIKEDASRMRLAMQSKEVSKDGMNSLRTPAMRAYSARNGRMRLGGNHRDKWGF